MRRLGAGKYVAGNYARGVVTLREAAEVLGITTREALELFGGMGISGNVGADLALKSILFAAKKPAGKGR